MSQTGIGAASTSQPAVVRIEDGTTTNLAAVSAGGALSVALSGGTDKDNADAIATVATGLTRVPSEDFIFNGTTWDRNRALSAVGDGLGVALSSQPSSVYGSATATNATATVTFAAVAGQSHRLTSANVAYSSAIVAAGNGTVLDGGANKLQWLGTNVPTGPQLPQGGMLAAAVNTTMQVVLNAGGAGTVGWVLATKLTA